MTFYERLVEVLEPLGIELAYGAFTEQARLPFAVYMGAGADATIADDRVYDSEGRWRIEYYFKNKNEQLEQAVESALTEAGLIWYKGEDSYIADQAIFVIYYEV